MNLFIRRATESDVSAVAALWRSLVGTDGCTWDEEYPGIEEAQEDAAHGDLYVLCTDENKIIGAMAAGEDSELCQYDFWSDDINRHCFCSRLGIAAAYQNRGLAGFRFSEVEKDVFKRGYDGIGFLVSPENLKALSVYDKLDYVKVGECALYEQDWFCYEKKLTE